MITNKVNKKYKIFYSSTFSSNKISKFSFFISNWPWVMIQNNKKKMDPTSSDETMESLYYFD